MRHLLKTLFITGVIGVLCVGIAELAVRLILPHPSFSPYPTGHVPGFMVTHPRREFAYAANFSGIRITHDYGPQTITTNDLGLRNPPLKTQLGAQLRILALGNSFTAGLGVEDTDSWPAQLQQRLNDANPTAQASVINAGTSGYNLRQMRLMAEELIPVVRPQLIILAIFVGGQDRMLNPYVYFHDALVRQSVLPLLEPVEGGFLRISSPYARPWAARIDKWMQRYFHFGEHLLLLVNRLRSDQNQPRPPSPTRRQATALLQPLLDKMVRLKTQCDLNDIELLTVLINQQQANGDYLPVETMMNDVINQYFKNREIPVVDLLPVFEKRSERKAVFRYAEDGHWPAVGHQLAAEQIALWVLEQHAIAKESNSEAAVN